MIMKIALQRLGIAERLSWLRCSKGAAGQVPLYAGREGNL
jgi:hypothetical protein